MGTPTLKIALPKRSLQRAVLCNGYFCLTFFDLFCKKTSAHLRRIKATASKFPLL